MSGTEKDSIVLCIRYVLYESGGGVSRMAEVRYWSGLPHYALGVRCPVLTLVVPLLERSRSMLGRSQRLREEGLK